jgi:hypothetical protein
MFLKRHQVDSLQMILAVQGGMPGLQGFLAIQLGLLSSVLGASFGSDPSLFDVLIPDLLFSLATEQLRVEVHVPFQ